MTRKRNKNASSDSSNSFSQLATEDKLDKLIKIVQNGFANTEKEVKDLSKRFLKVETKILVIEKRVETFENMHDQIVERVHSLQAEVNSLHQDKLLCDMIIRGIPSNIATDEQALLTLVQLLIDKTNCAAPINITAVRRLGRPNANSNAKTPILVQFAHQAERDSVLASKKKVRLNCAQITYEGQPIGLESDIIYFEESLTKPISDIYYNARVLRKRLLIKHTWIRSGIVYIRVNENDKAIKITDVHQLKRFEKRHRLSSTMISKNGHPHMEIDDESMSNDEQGDENSGTEDPASPDHKIPRTNDVKPARGTGRRGK